MGHCRGPSSIPSMAYWVKGFSIVTVVAWVVAVAWIQFKVQELPCAAGAAIKQNKTTTKKPHHDYSFSAFVTALVFHIFIWLFDCLLTPLQDTKFHESGTDACPLYL